LGLGNVGGVIAGVIADQRGVAFALTATTLLMAGAIAAAAGYVLSMRRLAPRTIAMQA
jgi:hypothetical protein